MYEEYLSGAHWQAVKEAMYARYKVCQLCNKKYNLQVHHVLGYERIGKERLGKDVVLVCGTCHTRCHYRLNGYKIPLTEADLSRQYRFLNRTKYVRNFRLGSFINAIASHIASAFY